MGAMFSKLLTQSFLSAVSDLWWAWSEERHASGVFKVKDDLVRLGRQNHSWWRAAMRYIHLMAELSPSPGA